MSYLTKGGIHWDASGSYAAPAGNPVALGAPAGQNITLTVAGGAAVQVSGGALNLNGQRVTGLADGTAATDAVTKQQLDAAAGGISVHKAPVRVAAVPGDLDGWVPAGGGAAKTLTAPAAGVASADGAALAAADRVLVRDSPAQVSNWTVPAGDGGWADQDYFVLVDHTGSRYVYFTLDGSGAADPAPGGTLIGAVDVDTATPDTGAQVADKIRAVVGADAAFAVDAAGSATLVVTSALLGSGAGAPSAATSPLTLNSSALDQAHNGIYYVSTAGAVGVACVLTRAPDADGAPAGEVAGGDFVMSQEGTAGAGDAWVLQGLGALAVDTDPQVWSQFAAGAGGALGDLTDVAITAPAAGEILRRNAGNTAWVNETLAAAGVVSNSYARVAVNAAAYAVAAGVQIVGVRYTATGAAAVTLPQAAAGTRRITIVDEGGGAAANNITVSAFAGDTIVGGSQYVIDRAYNSINLYNDGGTEWFIA